jgi:urea transporter
MEIKVLLGKIAAFIINPIIFLGFIIATIVLFYGIVQMIASSDSSDLPEKRRAVIYGVIGMFVMFSVYGILNLVLTSFGIPTTNIPF